MGKPNTIPCATAPNAWYYAPTRGARFQIAAECPAFDMS